MPAAAAAYLLPPGCVILSERKMKPPSEMDLLQGALAAHAASLAEIYDLFSPRLYRYAMRLLGDDGLAEDCVSETFTRFLKALRNGQGPRQHLQAYLFRIAHNWITDQYRRQPPPPAALDEDDLADDSTRPDAQADERARQARVRLALRALTPDQRLVVTLRFIEGWENQDVADAMQKPVGAVKALQHRGLAALRQMLKSAEEDVL